MLIVDNFPARVPEGLLVSVQDYDNHVVHNVTEEAFDEIAKYPPMADMIMRPRSVNPRIDAFHNVWIVYEYGWSMYPDPQCKHFVDREMTPELAETHNFRGMLAAPWNAITRLMESCLVC